jgi:O-antigen/teichoic acid export membrane protein
MTAVQHPASNFRYILSGAAGAFAVQVLGAGLGVVSHLFIARILGQAQYGVYALMLSWVSLLAAVSQIGQDVSVVRFLPIYLANQQWGLVKGLRRGIGSLVFLVSSIVALGGCVFVHSMSGHHDATWRATFYIGFAMLPVLTQLQQSGALHRAFKRAIRAGIYITVVRPLLTIVLVGLFALASSASLDSRSAAWASALAAVLAVVFSAWSMSRDWPTQARHVAPAYDLRSWSRLGLQLSTLSIFVIAGNRLDVLILGALADSDQLAAYYVAVQMAAFGLFGLQAANVLLAPMIAERYASQNLTDLEVVTRQSAWIAFAVAVGATLFFAVAGKFVLGLFGQGFTSAYVPLMILLCGYSLVAALGEVGFMLSMTSFQSHAAAFVLLGIVINSVASLILVPKFGSIGAATGATLSLLTWRLCAFFFVLRRLRINPSIVGSGMFSFR